MEMLDKCDIKMLLWHDHKRLIARRNKGKGTLSVSIDEKGVFFSFEAPNTPDGDTALELVKRGDLAGCSFAYSVSNEKTDVSYERVNDEEPVLRKVKHIAAVYDMTICSDPAYQDTTVSAREAIEDLTKPVVQTDNDAYKRDVARLRENAKIN